MNAVRTSKPIASLSLDLDNQWSYMKTHGDPGWESYPSYLDLLIPRVLAFLADRNLRITIFVVGQDAALERNREALAAVAGAGHEIGNHSFRHEPWLHRYSEEEIERELALAEESIEAATGVRPIGFRGPGFSVSQATLRVLARRGYLYDASTFPTYVGPLARAYFFMTARLSREERAERRALFGSLADGLRPVSPYRWRLGDQSLLEIPVTTMPILKTPIHVSYLLYMASHAPALALAYFGTALRFCRWMGVAPSLLLHPLDFLGADDTKALAFFPAMGVPSRWKLEQLGVYFGMLQRSFAVCSMREHAELLADESTLPMRTPRFSNP